MPHVPFVTSLYDRYPNSTLITWGEAVGLLDGQMGNSEVGHWNLGAGRVVFTRNYSESTYRSGTRSSSKTRFCFQSIEHARKWAKKKNCT